MRNRSNFFSFFYFSSFHVSWEMVFFKTNSFYDLKFCYFDDFNCISKNFGEYVHSLDYCFETKELLYKKDFGWYMNLIIIFEYDY